MYPCDLSINFICLLFRASERPQGITEGLGGDLGVTLGDHGGGVAHDELHGSQGHVLDGVGPEGMAQQVRVYVFSDAGSFAGVVE